jgi:hypothetical protein
MAALTDVEHVAVVDHRANVDPLLRHLGEREQAVDAGQYVGIDLDEGNKLLHVVHELGKESSSSMSMRSSAPRIFSHTP